MFDEITSLFQSKENVPDLIEVLDLNAWYTGLSEEQRQKLHQYSTSFGIGGEVNLLEQSVEKTTRSAQEYLKGVGSTAANEKEYKFAEMVLLSALEFEDGSATSTHFTYNELIDVYYKQRDNRKDALEKCIEYCKKDIETADDFVGESGEVPRFLHSSDWLSFTRSKPDTRTQLSVIRHWKSEALTEQKEDSWVGKNKSARKWMSRVFSSFSAEVGRTATQLNHLLTNTPRRKSTIVEKENQETV